jgi:predicted Fe-Mo cluster-binding NifX family protein
MRIAVSTFDGRTVCGELGKCNRFMIFDADNHGILRRGLRFFPGPARQNLLQDCQAVITQGMGRGMYEGLITAGIIPVLTLEEDPEAAVRQFLSEGFLESAEENWYSTEDN